MLLLLSVHACNPVDMAGPQHIDPVHVESVPSVSIDKELKVLAEVSSQMSARFMAMSPRERREWVLRAEHLLQSTSEQRMRMDGDFRSDMDSADAAASEAALQTMLASFDRALYIQKAP
jgi:hypothetical protein